MIPPLLNIYDVVAPAPMVELYRDRHDDAAARVIWNAIEPNLAKLYPKNFDYACGPGGRTERRALFGDLVTAMYYYFEDHGDAAVPHFAPGATALLSPRFRRSSNTSPPETIRSLMTGSSGPSLRHIIRPSLDSGAMTVSPDLESVGLADEPERPAKHVSFAAEASQAAASPACAHLLQRWSGQSTYRAASRANAKANADTKAWCLFPKPW